jgi:hypothetical protein
MQFWNAAIWLIIISPTPHEPNCADARETSAVRGLPFSVPSHWFVRNRSDDFLPADFPNCLPINWHRKIISE